MAEKFYIADESLGGIEREYVESGRKAEVGDYIINNKGTVFEGYYRVTGYDNTYTPSYTVGHDDSLDEYTFAVSVELSITLIPTGNVRIDGERIFRMVDRKAEVGEKVIHLFEGKAEDDTVFVVSSVNDEEIRFPDLKYEHVDEDGDGGYVTGIDHGSYRVLEPLEPEEVPQATPDVIDILTNLAQAVVRLQKEVDSLSEQTDSNAKDIVTFAEEFTEFKEQQTVKDVDISDLSYNVSRFVSDYLKEGLRYE